MEIQKENKNEENIIFQNNTQFFLDKKIKSLIKQYFKDLKVLLNKRPINAKGKSELFQFKKKIIDLIKDTFKEKYILFCYSEDEIDLQLFIGYLCQLLEAKMSKMIEGYNALEKMDKNQLLLLSKTKNTILSYLISFYDFYEDELVINNEEIVAEIVNKKNNLEDSFVMTLVKIINLLNMPYITKDEFINIFKDDEKKNKKIILGYLLLKIIELLFKIKNLNINVNKKRNSKKNVSFLENNNDDRNMNKNNDQFSIFLGICFENIVPSLIEFFSNVILEYDIKNTIDLIIKKDELSVLLSNFNHIKIIRHKILNFLCNSEKLFNKEQNLYIKNMVIKNNLFEKILSFINKDINNNKYFSVKDFLLEIKKVIKYYIFCNIQSEEIDKKIINIISIGSTKIKNKNAKNIKIQNNEDILTYFFKEINGIGKEEPEQKYKVYNFLIIIFQSSPFLRQFIYKILLNNFSGDLDNYQDMLGHTNFLSIFVGNLCKCDKEIIDYFFGFLHSLDKFKYFPGLELTNIIYSLSCFTDVESVQILINNLEIYNNDLKSNKNKYAVNNLNKSVFEDNTDEQKDLIDEMNRSFLDIFSNIINDIINDYEEKNKNNIIKEKEEIIENKNNENNEKTEKNEKIEKTEKIEKIEKIEKNEKIEKRNVFSAEMIFPLLEYISKIIQDTKIYQYFIDKKFIHSLNSMFNTNEHKIVAYKFIELLIKSSQNKEMNEDRIKVILNRIDIILNYKEDKNNKNKKILDEFEKINELILILKSIIILIEYDILPNKDEDIQKNTNTINLINKKDIKENIIEGLSKCFDYFNSNKEAVISVFNDKYHELIKEYLNNIFILFIQSNKNCLNKINLNAPEFENTHFELIIHNILALYKLVDENENFKNTNYFFDIIIFLVNKSININKIEKKINTLSKDNKNDFDKYYMNLLSIDEKNIINNANNKTIYSNICILNPHLIVTILNSLSELNIYIDNYLKLIYLFCKINKGNISLLLRQKLLSILLNISIKENTTYNEILYKLFEISLPFIQKKDLVKIFEHLIKAYNNNKLNFSKEIIQCLIDSFQNICFSPKEYGKGIILSGYEVKQPNIYNLMNIDNITFYNYVNESMIYVKQEIIFYDSLESNKLILFRIDKTGDNKKNQFIEISIINGILSANENIVETNEQNDKNDLQINAKNFININELNTFIFKFDNTEKILSININRKNIFSYPYHFSFNQNISRSKVISGNTNLSKMNSKNNNNNMTITIGYPLENIKGMQNDEFHKLSCIKIISCSILDERDQAIPNKNKKKNTINIYELEMNNISIESTKKKIFSNLTVFKLDKKTTLINKYNIYEYASLNGVYHRYNLKSQLYKYLIFIDKYLSYSLDYNFRIEKYIFILLNNNNIGKDIFKVLIQLLTNYVINNNENMSSFMEKEELSSTLYFILLKNASYIDAEIVDILFSCFLSQKNFKNNFLINVFLDYKLFDSLKLEAKIHALQLIINKKILNSKNELIELLYKKLYIILLLCDFDKEEDEECNNNKKGIDELIISIIVSILSKNENNNYILKSIEELLYNLCKFHSMVKEHLENSNKGRKDETHYIITNFFHKLYNSISVIKDKDLLQKSIEELNNLDKNYKDKLLSICKSYKSINLSTNIVMTFRESIRKSSRISVRNPETKFEYNSENKEINDVEENLSTFQKFPKIVNEFIGGFKKRKKINDTESNQYNLEEGVVDENNTWINSEIKSGKLVETEKIICMGNCHLCNFIRIILDDLFTREIKFNTYENYMLNNYIDTFIFNKNLDYKIQFGHYLAKEEGTSRIRNKFRIKVDKVLNKELEEKKKTNEKEQNNEKQKEEKNELENIFGFYKDEKISSNLCNFFNLGQIFDIDFISDCIDKGDTYQCSFNCLLFQGLNYINSVLILSEKKLYILTNMILDSDLILYNVDYPIKKSFWVVDNYADMVSEQFDYLQAYDLINDNYKILKKRSSKKININTKKNEEEGIKSKQIRGFKLICFSYGRINELHKKRFLHQNNAIEIFLKTGINYYLAFNKGVRDTVVNNILQNISNSINYINETFICNSNSINNCIHLNQITNYNNQSTKSDNMIFMTDTDLFIEKIKKVNNSKNKQKKNNKNKNNCKITDVKEILEEATEKWSNGYINTYSYIMILNTLSGRTFNDLAQYPVYPWILNDYSSDKIDLKNSNSYRDFLYPIYAQDEESRETLKDKYNSFEEKEIKYHSGSHYSNSAFVCYYLVRVKPYSISASEIQGGRFDAPDRLFFNIKNFYKVQTKYQELIPDFFDLPEIYININNFNFGKTLEGITVTDAILPPWASDSPRLFSKMNKKALESEYVSQQINNWIDLIFGYKQKGIEAEKSYNVLREVCSNFNPQNYKDDDDELELKINELCEMGIDPIQLFNKPHPKRERHHIMKAFFGRSAYLTYFTPVQNKYKLKNFNSNSIIQEINKYYEDNTGVLSNGEGGLSSFRICYDNNNNYDKNKDENNNDDIYFIVGEKKKLIPPSYKNFIEWGNKNSFNIVKPFKNIRYKFTINHMKDKIIEHINITRNGKFFILGYNNGVIEKYALQKIDESLINNDNYSTINNSKSNEIRNSDASSQSIKKSERKKSIFNSLMSSIRKISDNDIENEDICKTFNMGDQKVERDTIGMLNTTRNLSNMSNFSISDSNNIKINKKSNKIIFDTHITISFSNILNSDCILLNKKTKKFYQYNSIPSNIYQDNLSCYDKIFGYYIHSINQSEIKKFTKNTNENNKSNFQKKYIIFLLNSSSRILSDIYKIEICESFSFMIVIDKMNKVYLYDFNSFNIIKFMDFSTIFNLKLKYISICPYTGDFIVATKRNVALMNINGVFLSQKSDIKSNINSCFISLIPTTQSDLYLFTGHEDGNIIIAKIIINNTNNYNLKISSKTIGQLTEDNEKRLKCVRNVYIDSYTNKDNNYKKYSDINNLPLIFDNLIKIKCSQNPLKFIKLTEDLTEMICIDNNNQLIYLNYKEFFNIKNKNKDKDKKNLKECPMCKSAISSSKILCYLCGKKLCSKCKIEEIIAEFSFKTKKAICEDCLQLMNSTNKLLYDF